MKFTGLFAALIWLPWMASSVIMSGYLFYPITFPNIFSFDWKTPQFAVQFEQDTIRMWARVPRGEVRDVINMPIQTWFKIWSTNQTLNRRLLAAFALLTPALVGLASWLSPRLRMRLHGSGYWFALFGAYAGGTFWFLSAPDIRFGYAYLVPILCLGLSDLFLFLESSLAKQKWVSMLPLALVIGAFLFTSLLFFRSINVTDLGRRALLPAEYPGMPTTPVEVGNFTVMVAQSYQACWYEPFPCIPLPTENVYKRGESFQEGFYYLDN